MIGADTLAARRKRAQDLLGELLSREEFISVLKFSQERGLDSDNEIFFLISMLKIFAHVHVGILEAIGRADTGRQRMEATVIMAEDGLGEIVEEAVAFFQEQMAQVTAMMGHEAGRFEKVAYELKGLRDGLRAVTSDVERALDAYQAAKGDRPAVPLARILVDQFTAELRARAPQLEAHVGARVTDAITRATRRILIAIGGGTAMIAVLMLLHHR